MFGQDRREHTGDNVSKFEPDECFPEADLRRAQSRVNFWFARHPSAIGLQTYSGLLRHRLTDILYEFNFDTMCEVSGN